MKISKCDISKTTRSNSKPFHRSLVLYIVYKRSNFRAVALQEDRQSNAQTFSKISSEKNIKITTKSKVRDQFQ